mmetsp:Transcript_17056/g.35141  ORF Transcript_17056/g.35141 Transcript_17056/m.35141 type:complete len:112 (+) Transcript_17056:150-485(+)
MDVETSRAGGTCQIERRPSVLLPPAKRRRAITAARQSSWQSCEMPGTDIDLGELWVRMLCFEEHWLSHDLELYSHRSSMGSCAWDINSKGQFQCSEMVLPLEQFLQRDQPS